MQALVLSFLSRPATHGGHPVQRIDTHAAAVFLAGEDVWKVKKAVRFPFLDFTTLAARKAACLTEIKRNQAVAPEIYLDVAAIVPARRGGFTFAEASDPAAIEYAVHMRRFPADALLADMETIDRPLAEALGDAVAVMHQGAAVRRGAARMDGVIAETAAELVAPGAPFPPARAAALNARVADLLSAAHPLMMAREAGGRVRLCHGDLHLGNIVLLDRGPVPFDALEFDESLAVTDVAYDLAFLLMDLWERGMRAAANAVLNRWLTVTEDLEALALLPLFMAERALIRAKIAATRGDRAEAMAYFGAAEGFAAPPEARLVAIGGLSGSGKTTVARALAPDIGPAPGAVIVRSDVIRKRRAGIPETAKLPPEAYTRAGSQAVYAAMWAAAASVLRAGHACILDAVQADPAERARAGALAGAAGVPFTGLWLDAPVRARQERVSGRSGDASDADAAVVNAQAAWDTGMIDWPRIAADAGPDAVVTAARAVLSGRTSRPAHPR